jgi:hypothetical protein
MQQLKTGKRTARDLIGAHFALSGQVPSQAT